MLNLREFRNRAHHLADWLPWACLVAPGVILNKDGSFQRTIKYRGPDLDSATDAELISVSSRVNNVLKRFGAGWALYFDAVRIESTRYPHSRFPDAVSWLVDEERRASFEGRDEEAWSDPSRPQGRYFETEFYLTLIYLPPVERVSRLERMFLDQSAAGSKDANSGQPDADRGKLSRNGYGDQLNRFIQETDRAVDLLASVLQEIEVLDDAATLTYLHSCISTKRHPVRVPDVPMYLDAVLCDEPLTGGLSPAIGRSHLRTITVLGFPAVTYPGILDDLNRLGVSYRWTTRFIPLDRAGANSTLTRYRRQWFAKRKSVMAIVKEVMFNEQAALLDSDASNKAADADLALQELGDDLVAFGYATTTVTVRDPDAHTADEQIQAVERAINSRGFTTIRENVNAVEAWLGSIPGQVYANVRQPIVHTLNLAHLCPLSAVWAGPERCEHLDGPPLLIAKTKGATPFRLSLFAGDVGHSMVVGPTGAGKSVLLSVLALQFRRYKDAQVIVFDKGRSARAMTLAMKGAWYDLGNAASLAFQPLRDADDDNARLWALDWTCGVLAHEKVLITPDIKEAVWSALKSLGSAPVNQRTMTGLVALLARNTLRQALQPYTLEGPYGRFLDADSDRLSSSSVLTFEMEELMALPGLVAPVLTYLFHALEERFDGRPTLLVLDEAWIFLDDPLFSGRIREWLKTLRKRNVAVIFATQSLSDIANSEIAPAIIESCPSRIFLPNARALEEGQADIYRRFGLNDAQIRLIAESFPKRDYYLQSRAGSRLFELGLGPVGLAFAAASSAEDQRLIDAVIDQFGIRDFAERFLAAKDLGWASNLMRTFQDIRRH